MTYLRKAGQSQLKLAFLQNKLKWECCDFFLKLYILYCYRYSTEGFQKLKSFYSGECFYCFSVEGCLCPWNMQVLKLFHYFNISRFLRKKLKMLHVYITWELSFCKAMETLWSDVIMQLQSGTLKRHYLREHTVIDEESKSVSFAKAGFVISQKNKRSH